MFTFLLSFGKRHDSVEERISPPREEQGMIEVIKQSATFANILWQLSKGPLSMLVMATAGAGFVLSSHDSYSATRLSLMLFGVALCAGGANAFNQYLERDLDRKMTRTRNRPLPSGRMQPRQAFIAAWLFVVCGIAILLLGCGWLPAVLAGTNAAVYVLIYTPMKRHSSLCTLVGALVGALPPVIGWTAATPFFVAGLAVSRGLCASGISHAARYRCRRQMDVSVDTAIQSGPCSGDAFGGIGGYGWSALCSRVGCVGICHGDAGRGAYLAAKWRDGPPGFCRITFILARASWIDDCRSSCGASGCAHSSCRGSTLRR
jgi:hypothetical protein